MNELKKDLLRNLPSVGALLETNAAGEWLAEALGQTPERIDEMIRLLADAGSVLRLDRKVAMHRDAVAAAEKVVLDLFAKASSFETVEFRDALNVSRKFAVPLLTTSTPTN